MIELIGAGVIWIAVCIFGGFIINASRAKSGTRYLNDGVTAFIQGFTFGPIGILAAFAPHQSSQGKTLPMALGGLIGTYLFLSFYTS